jgi:hypothetical protein
VRDLYTVALTYAQVARAIEEYVLRGQKHPDLVAKVDATFFVEAVSVKVSQKRASPKPSRKTEALENLVRGTSP